jgi:hypothetical protein
VSIFFYLVGLMPKTAIPGEGGVVLIAADVFKGKNGNRFSHNRQGRARRSLQKEDKSRDNCGKLERPDSNFRGARAPDVFVWSRICARAAHYRLQFQKRSQLFIGAHNETLSIIVIAFLFPELRPAAFRRTSWNGSTGLLPQPTKRFCTTARR